MKNGRSKVQRKHWSAIGTESSPTKRLYVYFGTLTGKEVLRIMKAHVSEKKEIHCLWVPHTGALCN